MDRGRRLAPWGALLGQHCLLCEAASGEDPVCRECARTLPEMPVHCPQCAMPSPGGAACGACVSTPPAYDATVALWPYRFPVDRLVQAFKFHARLQLAPWFARALGTRDPQADRIVAMPLHVERLAGRGFNQAHELAKRLAASTRVPLLARGVRRVRPTGEQSRLAHAARPGNVRGAFACEMALDGLAVAVVDDVMTTGATLDELARTLKRAGARRVVNWVLARTLFE